MTNEEKTDFSLVLGGPFYRFYLRTRLLRPPMELLHRRIFAFVCLTWLPLALLAALADLGASARFLISLPLVIGVQPLVRRRLRVAVNRRVKNGI